MPEKFQANSLKPQEKYKYEVRFPGDAIEIPEHIVNKGANTTLTGPLSCLLLWLGTIFFDAIKTTNQLVAFNPQNLETPKNSILSYKAVKS